MSTAWEGMILLDKPAGPTSHDVVARVRRATGQRRIGHTGTLDPAATGLLVLLLGTATRLARYVPSAPKLYEGTFELGVTTRTDDLAGSVVARHGGALPSEDEVREHAARLVGPGRQVPPAISARQVAGQRLYRAARRGVLLEAPAVAIEVFRFEIRPSEPPARWAYEASVSTGTFIRGLVRDLGAALGCGAVVASLRRTRIGGLDVANAVADPDHTGLLARALVPVDAVPLDLPDVSLTEAEAARYRHGERLARNDVGGVVSLRGPEGVLLGVGEAVAGIVMPRVVLTRPDALGAVAPSDAPVIPSARSSN